MSSIIKVKRGLKENLDKAKIEQGELKFTTDTEELYVDNGENHAIVKGKDTDLVQLTKAENANKVIAVNSQGTGLIATEAGGGSGGGMIEETFESNQWVEEEDAYVHIVTNNGVVNGIYILVEGIYILTANIGVELTSGTIKLKSPVPFTGKVQLLVVQGATGGNTLASYGITDAYTKVETSEIVTTLTQNKVSLVQAGGHDLNLDSDSRVIVDKFLTKAEYDALSTEEKNNGMTYYVTDEDPIGAVVQGTGQSTSDVMSQKAVTDEIESINTDIENVYNKTEVDEKISQAKSAVKSEIKTDEDYNVGELYYNADTNGVINLANGLNQKTSATEITLPTPPSGRVHKTLLLYCSATSVTWTGNIVWEDGVEPTLSEGLDVIIFTGCEGKWRGSYGGHYAE